MSLRSRLRLTRLDDESGMTLVEMMVTLSLLGVVIGAFLGIFDSVQKALVREGTRTTTVDQTRLAIEELDREIRSGNVIYDPANEPSPSIGYYGLRVYTQANAPTRNGGQPMCVQYRIQNKSLLRRWWPSGNTAASTGWRDVADGIQNYVAAGSPNNVPAFQLDTSPSEGGGTILGSRIVDITLLVNSKTSDVTSGTVRLISSVAIRNQTSGDPCTPVPSG
jgi:prepilin-type N-terminal cleavage/methylation domain-containing protein